VRIEERNVHIVSEEDTTGNEEVGPRLEAILTYRITKCDRPQSTGSIEHPLSGEEELDVKDNTWADLLYDPEKGKETIGKD